MVTSRKPSIGFVPERVFNRSRATRTPSVRGRNTLRPGGFCKDRLSSCAPLVVLASLLTVACTCGCGSLRQRPQEPLAAGTEQSTVTDPMVVVELRDGDDDHEYLRAPLKQPMLVQDALKGSGAIDRFQRMDIVLVRNLPGGEKLRLPVRFVSTTGRVADENNYALQPGDWLEVSEDTSTTFDRMIEQALEPFEPMMRASGR